MPGARKKKKPATQGASGLSQMRPGMPALDSIEEVKDFVSPQGVHYKILKTTETDAYDPPLATKKSGFKPKRKTQ